VVLSELGCVTDQPQQCANWHYALSDVLRLAFSTAALQTTF